MYSKETVTLPQRKHDRVPENWLAACSCNESPVPAHPTGVLLDSDLVSGEVPEAH